MTNMIDPNERQALLRLVLAKRQTSRESLALAALYAGQLTACTLILLGGYHWADRHGGIWAVVSAALVLQPGLTQAIGASLVRIAANLVGGLAGIAAAALIGEGLAGIVVALVVCTFVCELLHLDLGLRTACVSVLIVMSTDPAHVVSSGYERLFAVTVGCVLGTLVQLASNRVARRITPPAPVQTHGDAPPIIGGGG